MTCRVGRLAVAFALTTFVLASTGLLPLSANAADEAKALLESMEASPPDWLPSLDQCPADAMPARETKSGYFKSRCENALERCLQNCRAGDAPDCYAAAQALLRVKKDSSIPQALFLRACAMGVASGCTNRAASMDLEGVAIALVQSEPLQWPARVATHGLAP